MHVKRPTERRADALAAVDWVRIDPMTDDDIARQIAANPDVPADLSDAPADGLLLAACHSHFVRS
ncbi:hypothetical protein [Azospirillum brasilense]|uniref:Uncharacterized protein n=1 Tax=Azospirillum brasilense TaxID=192 RepID=A0A6L3AS82_AZOBR|nr:hypothetical protein [Azospirillum brasilense]KAA0678022.1 hypothetical protein DS837_28500 [Azospirillum brasilense]